MSEPIWIKCCSPWTDYEICQYGAIRKLYSKLILKQADDRHGYKVVSLRINRIKKTYKIHRIIALTYMIINTNDQVDHINGVRTDNRIINLRKCDIQYNARNRTVFNIIKTSRFKGVSWERNKWRARLKVTNKYLSLGSFVKEEDAALAYNEKAISLFGNFAAINDLNNPGQVIRHNS